MSRITDYGLHTWQYSFEANNDPNVAAKGR